MNKNLTSKVDEDIIDLDLSVIRKKRFRINNDDSKILELNTSDMTVVTRLDEVYGKLEELVENAKKVAEETGDTDSELTKMSNQLKAIDKDMRDLVDYIFNAPVSKICADDGSMYDPFNGTYRFEHIIDTLTKLYEQNLNSEYKKMRARVTKHTAKYTKK